MSLLLLSLCVSLACSEWLGTLSTPSPHTYSSLSFIRTNPSALHTNFNLIATDGSFNSSRIVASDPLIWLVRLGAVEKLEDLLGNCSRQLVKSVLFVTDENLTSWAGRVETLSLFTISNEDGEALEKELETYPGPMPVTLVYAFVMNCAPMHALAWLYVMCSTCWLQFFLLWLFNNGRWNSEHAWLSHKVMVLIPAFKLLSAYASFAFYIGCPFSRLSSGLMQLVQNQFRSLYETSLMCLLILLSKGLFVTRSDFSRIEFNQLSVSASMIYVTVSAYNTMGGQADLTIVGMYVFMWVYCGYNSLATARQLARTVARVAHTQVTDLIQTFAAKQRALWSFVCAYLLLFAVETGIHLKAFLSAEITDDDYIRPYSSFHEGMELLLVGWIYYIYRARPQNRYFTLLNDGRQLPRFSPVYKVSMFLTGNIGDSWQSEVPVLVLNPGELWNSKYPFERVTLGTVQLPTDEERLKGQPLLPGSIELARIS